MSAGISPFVVTVDNVVLLLRRDANDDRLLLELVLPDADDDDDDVGCCQSLVGTRCGFGLPKLAVERVVVVVGVIKNACTCHNCRPAVDSHSATARKKQWFVTLCNDGILAMSYGMLSLSLTSSVNGSTDL